MVAPVWERFIWDCVCSVPFSGGEVCIKVFIWIASFFVIQVPTRFAYQWASATLKSVQNNLDPFALRPRSDL